MRFDMRLHGRTASGEKCQADISVYAGSERELEEQTQKTAMTAVWLTAAAPYDPIPEGAHITVEHVEKL